MKLLGITLLAATLLAVVSTSCAHKNANGCTEYKPWCLGNQMICVTDARGCVTCTCESGQRDGQIVPDRGGADPTGNTPPR